MSRECAAYCTVFGSIGMIVPPHDALDWLLAFFMVIGWIFTTRVEG